MKSLILLVVAFLSFSAISAQNYIDNEGTVKTRYQGKPPMVVKNSASAALTVGEAVCLDLTDDDGISVDYCATSGWPAVCMIMDTSCAVGSMCKCQTSGYFATASFDPTEGNAVAGAAIYAGTDGSVHGDTSQGEKQPIGIALDAASATGSLEVFLKF